MDQVRVTAMVMLDILGNDTKVTAAELRDRLNGAGGHVRYIQKAAKYLRDRGITVVATKRRQRSEWWIAAAADEIPEFQRRVVAEAYSEQVSLARSVAHLTGPLSRKVYDTAKRAAIGWGEFLGKDVDTVVNECRPLQMM